MGGSFLLVYDGEKDGNHKFTRPGNPDWPTQTYLVPPAELTKTIYVNVPEGPAFLNDDTEYRLKRLIHPEHERSCKACRAAGRVYVEFAGPLDDDGFATVVFNGPDRAVLAVHVQCYSAPPDHPKRAELHRSAERIAAQVGRDLGWRLSGDRRYWIVGQPEDVPAAYAALVALGYTAGERAAAWVGTGVWPE